MKKTFFVAALVSCTCASLHAQSQKDKEAVCAVRTVSYASIQDAVNSVVKNDTIKILSDVKLASTIKVAESTPAFTLDLNGHVLDASNIPVPTKAGETANIIENYGDLTIIDTNPEAVHTDSLLASIKGGIFTGGKGGYNFAALKDGKPTYQCTIRGGAIYSIGILNIKGVTFYRNTAVYGGAVICMSKKASISDCHFLENVAGKFGGAVFGEDRGMEIKGCTFKNNEADTGGGFYTCEDTVSISNCNFTGNIASAAGGACDCQKSVVDFHDCSFTENYAGTDGGAICQYYGILTFENCDMSGNTCDVQGGATSLSGKTTFKNCTVTDNNSTGSYASGGVYVWSEDDLTLQGKMIIKNNNTNGVAANLCLSGDSSCTQVIFDGLAEGSEIGVSTEICDIERATRFSVNSKADDAKYLHADNPLYSLNYNKDGYYETIYEPVGQAVCSIGDKTYTSIQDAINMVGEEDTIKIIDDIKLTSTIRIPHITPVFFLDLNGHVLDGSNIPEPKLDGNKLGNIIENNGVMIIIDSNPESVHTDSLATIKGGVITGGKGGHNRDNFNKVLEDLHGGAIFNNGEIIVKGGTFFHNSAVKGGAIYSKYAFLTVTGGKFIENKASYTGGAISTSDSYSYISDCSFTGNEGQYGGAIELLQDSATIKNSNFDKNIAHSGGAAIYSGYSVSTVKGCTFNENESDYLGGAIGNGESEMKVEECKFTDNYAKYYGGAINNDTKMLECVNCEMTGNNAGMQGGAINSFTELTLDNCKITGNCSSGNFPAGGVYVWISETTTLKGENIIKDNLTLGRPANLCLSGEESVSLVNLEGLSEKSVIGVSTEANDIVSTAQFTSDATASDAKCFTSDNDTYKVVFNSKGYLETVTATDAPAICSIGDKKYASIQDAINVVAEKETIKVLEDVNLTYTIRIPETVPAFTLDLNGHVLDGSTMPEPTGSYRLSNIIENYADLTIIDSNPEAVHTDSLLVSIKGGVITGGKGGYNQFSEEYNDEYVIGGAIYTSGNLTMTGGTFIENKARFGGAIFSDNNTVTITSTNFYDNLATQTGGAIRFLNSKPTLIDCDFDGNVAASSGAIEDLQDTIVIKDCYFTNNYAHYAGSAIFASSSHSTVTGCTFGGNYTGEEGSSCYYLKDGTTNFKDCLFDQNEAAECGACCLMGKARLENCRFTKNYSGSYAGAILFYDGDFECVNCEVSENQADFFGGGIVSYSNLTLEDCTITLNTSVTDFPTAGIYVCSDPECSSSLVLKGKTIIKDNTTNGVAANLCLDGEPTCVLASLNGLTAGSEIGVTTGMDGVAGAFQFTTNGTEADAKYFFADSNNYLVKYNKAGYLELVPDPVGIDEISDSASDGTSAFEAYDLLGRRLNKVQKGINIIKSADKTMKLNIR